MESKANVKPINNLKNVEDSLLSNFIYLVCISFSGNCFSHYTKMKLMNINLRIRAITINYKINDNYITTNIIPIYSNK